jgi:hypothetical protein
MLSTLRRVEGYHIQVYDGNICRDEDSSVWRPIVFHWRYLFVVSFSQNTALRCLHFKTNGSAWCGHLFGQ